LLGVGSPHQHVDADLQPSAHRFKLIVCRKTDDLEDDASAVPPSHLREPEEHVWRDADILEADVPEARSSDGLIGVERIRGRLVVARQHER
jgi:hypothetical protein